MILSLKESAKSTGWLKTHGELTGEKMVFSEYVWMALEVGGLHMELAW